MPALVAAVAEAHDLASLRPDDLDVRGPRQQFPLAVIAGSLALVLRSGTRLQRVADVLSLHWKWSGLNVLSAGYYSVRLWLLRLGLYQLSRPKVLAGDWMWIVNHTMMIGGAEVRIIVGLRQSAWNAQDRVLDHEDVDVIDLVPVTESNGEVVPGSCRRPWPRPGFHGRSSATAEAICTRGSSDFARSIRATAWLYNVKHKTACILEAGAGSRRLLAGVLGEGPSLQAAGVAHSAGRLAQARGGRLNRGRPLSGEELNGCWRPWTV